MSTGGASKTAPSAESGSNLHMSDSLSRILTGQNNAATSGLAILQRAVAIQQGQIEADSGGKRMKETGSNEVDTRKVALPKPNPLVTTSNTTSSSNQTQSSRVSLPVVHGQNGQLLMLMNQSELVRLAQESAITHMLSSMAQRGPASSTATTTTTIAQQNETSSNDSATAGQSILANVVAPISPMVVQDQDSGGGDAGLLIEGGHTGHGPPGSSSDRAMRRKSVHNEVEKRRRQKINMWIEKLSAIIPPSPNSSAEQASQNTNTLSCKADVLQRTYDYVIQISKAHNDLSQMLSLVQQENELLRQEVSRFSNTTGNESTKPNIAPTASQLAEVTARVASPSSNVSNISNSPRSMKETTSTDQEPKTFPESNKDDTKLLVTAANKSIVTSKIPILKSSATPVSSTGARSGPVAIVLPATGRVALTPSTTRQSPVFATSLSVQQPHQRKRRIDEPTIDAD